MTSPSLMHEAGHSKPVHWNNPEGWDGVGGGRGVQDRGGSGVQDGGPMADSCQCVAKTTTTL